MTDQNQDNESSQAERLRELFSTVARAEIDGFFGDGANAAPSYIFELAENIADVMAQSLVVIGVSDKYGVIVGERGTEQVDDMPVFVVIGRDKMAPATIKGYAALVEQVGCDEELVASAQRSFVRTTNWQNSHEDLVRMPD